MKTDLEILDGAIALLERDEGWCQGSYYVTRNGSRVSHCAVGALGEAAGMWDYAKAVPLSPRYPDVLNGYRCNAEDRDALELILEQVGRVTDQLLLTIGLHSQCQFSVFNDKSSKEDVILAMKKTREQIQNEEK